MDDWPAVDGGFPEGPIKGTPSNTEASANGPLVDRTDNGLPVSGLDPGQENQSLPV